MHKALQIFKRIFKAILWVVAVFVFFFILLAGIIQLPSVQNALVSFATGYISNKTHTRVEIEHLGISFPNALSLEGVFIEDLQKDTLLYAGEARLNFSLKDVFNNHINVRHLYLDKAIVKVYNTPTDSLFNYQFLLTAFSSDTSTNAQSNPWAFNLDQLNIRNSRILYEDVYNQLYTSATIYRLGVKGISINTREFCIKLNEISLKDNAITYQTERNPANKKVFDAGNLQFRKLNLELRDILYSTEKKEFTVKQFSATDQNNFTITRFETIFKMDAHSITLAPLKANTSTSFIDGEVQLQFASLSSIADSLGQLKIKAYIRQSGFSNADIVYFSPMPATIGFFKNKAHITTLKGSIDGQINNLKGKNLIVKAGRNTVLNTSFHISGLPDMEKAHFDFPNLTIQSNKKDLLMMAGNLIPESIELPDNIRLNVDFYGGISDFESSAGLFSSYGNALMTASLAKGERYNVDLQLTPFDLGSLMKDKSYGQLSLNASAEGKGFDLNMLHAEINELNLGLNGKAYLLDSIIVDLTQQKQKNELKLRSDLLALSYSGNLSPLALAEWGTQFINRYFALTDTQPVAKKYTNIVFQFDIQPYNHPFIAEFLPDLHEFIPGVIHGNYDGSKEALNINAGIQKLIYGNNEIKDIGFELKSDAGALNYQLFTSSFSFGQMQVDNIRLKGKVADNQLSAHLSSIDDSHFKNNDLLKGRLEANALLKKMSSGYSITADAEIAQLAVQGIPVGNLSLKASNPVTDRVDIDLSLTGEGNDLSANGYYLLNGEDNAIKVDAVLHSLSMKTIEAFSMGQLSQASGLVGGKFVVEGNTNHPKINGNLTFKNAEMKPAFLNNTIFLKDESITLRTDGIYFNAFTIRDVNQQKAVVDGSIKMKEFSDFRFDLNVNSKDFLLFNTTAKDNDLFYGKMIIDSDIDISGPLSVPVVRARLKMKAGSRFSFVVPEEQLTTYKGEDIVVFTDSTKKEYLQQETAVAGFSGFDLSSVIEVDKDATLRLFMDPASSDSLVVKGNAALSLTMDRSGKMSLTGTYEVNEGSYLVSLESIIKKKFGIVPGSTIVWNGDPMDANININASYMVRTAPYNLVAEQMAGLTNAEQAGYKQQYPFVVLLKMRGEMMQPEISFEIQLLPEDKGILSGAMQQKLNLLNEDPSALNKQVFALLVLGRFVQENPLQSESAGTSALLRSTVSSFLTEQLNRFSSGFVPGVELNFDVQSYEDYQSGNAEGRTQVEVGLKKELFNNRLTVEIGGSVDVEGEKAKQNSAGNIAGDVTVEYKLTEDGRYRLKGFRNNQYEGVIEGQLVETGAGIVYVRDFNWWKELFRKPE
ncbi:MAG: translocation/assembly module TamB domain-containing protein [Paludibacter sp.]|nr:translocation/assembly module TamB domain-containing protein [Paludibacter sp.]